MTFASFFSALLTCRTSDRWNRTDYRRNHYDHINSMVNFFMTVAYTQKIATVPRIRQARATRKPNLFKIIGNTGNIGSVGRTYQKVYHAWFDILSTGCFSKNSQHRVSIVTVGREAIKAPALSLLFAVSAIITTSAEVIAYFQSRYMARRLSSHTQ